MDAGEMDTEGTQKNHQELHVVLVDALQRCAMVELYGCWAGDYAEKTEAVSEIDADAILADRFYFRERVLYRVRYPSGSTGGRSAGTTV